MITMKVIASLIALMVLAAGMTGCGGEVKGLKEEVKLLKEENSFLKAENAGLKKEIEELYKKLDEREGVVQKIGKIDEDKSKKAGDGKMGKPEDRKMGGSVDGVTRKPGAEKPRR
jgi:hypothetical protein